MTPGETYIRESSGVRHTATIDRVTPEQVVLTLTSSADGVELDRESVTVGAVVAKAYLTRFERLVVSR